MAGEVIASIAVEKTAVASMAVIFVLAVMLPIIVQSSGCDWQLGDGA